ncbi:hypothetical protein ACFC26_08925 [Kitasatospora purpeofusca]|uniref:hypothetical protein n=1 Tax=Kitasatospora purpeofusca TaxID=67352 RepID=UPI0035DAC289
MWRQSPHPILLVSELLAELTDRLQLPLPDPVERVPALLDWYGSGSGRAVLATPSTGVCLASAAGAAANRLLPVNTMHQMLDQAGR